MEIRINQQAIRQVPPIPLEIHQQQIKNSKQHVNQRKQQRMFVFHQIKMHQPSVMRFKRQSFKRHTAILESLMFGELKVRMLLTVQGLLMLYMPMRLVIISAVGQGISNTRGRKFLSVKHSLVICYFGEHQRV